MGGRRCELPAACRVRLGTVPGGLVWGHPDDLPPLRLEQVRGGADRGELAREDAARNRALASGIARTAYGRGRVEDDGDGRKPGCPGCGQPAAAAGHVGAERVDDGGQPAPEAGRHDLLENGERVDRGVEIVLT